MKREECLCNTRGLCIQLTQQNRLEKSIASSDWKAATGACLQQNGGAAQAACMERKECLCNTRGLCNQAHTANQPDRRAVPDLHAGACLQQNGDAAQIPCRERKGVVMPYNWTGQSSSYSTFSRRQAAASLVLQVDAGCKLQQSGGAVHSENGRDKHQP